MQHLLAHCALTGLSACICLHVFCICILYFCVSLNDAVCLRAEVYSLTHPFKVLAHMDSSLMFFLATPFACVTAFYAVQVSMRSLPRCCACMRVVAPVTLLLAVARARFDCSAGGDALIGVLRRAQGSVDTVREALRCRAAVDASPPHHQPPRLCGLPAARDTETRCRYDLAGTRGQARLLKAMNSGAPRASRFPSARRSDAASGVITACALCHMRVVGRVGAGRRGERYWRARLDRGGARCRHRRDCCGKLQPGRTLRGVLLPARRSASPAMVCARPVQGLTRFPGNSSLHGFAADAFFSWTVNR